MKVFRVGIYIFFFCLMSCSNSQSKLSLAEKEFIYKEVVELVKENFYDQNLINRKWVSVTDKYYGEIISADSDSSCFALLNKMLFELGVSHMGIGKISDLNNVASPYIFAEATLGIDIRFLNDKCIITNVDNNSSADLAGIKTGMEIVEINDKTISRILNEYLYRPPLNKQSIIFQSAEEILRNLFGEANTICTIVVKENKKVNTKKLLRKKRKGGEKVFPDFPPMFNEINSGIIDEKIGYLRFNSFRPDNPEVIVKELTELFHLPGIIIDIRGNNGGSPTAAGIIADYLIDDLNYYFKTYDRNGLQNWYVPENKKSYNGEIVLLVDEFSISAAELFAVMLKESERATIIGSATPGHLLSGSMFTINDDIALMIPVFGWESKNGFLVEGKGMTPDIKVYHNVNKLLNGIDVQLREGILFLDSKIE